MLVRHVLQHVRQFGEIAISEAELAERVSQARVEPCRDHDELGSERSGRGQQPVAERAQDLFAAGVRRERAIDGRVGPRARAGFVAHASAGIPRRLVRAKEQDGRVLVEDILRAVAVMHVPVHDQDALQAVALDRVARPDRDIVEDAESHALYRTRVVAGRTQRAEGLLDGSGQHRVDGRADRADGHARR